jgi:hypothetical protein
MDGRCQGKVRQVFESFDHKINTDFRLFLAKQSRYVN